MTDSDARADEQAVSPDRVRQDPDDVTESSGEPAYIRRAGVVTSDLDGEISLFDGSATALVLNVTASAVWTELAAPSTVTELATRLAGRFTGQDGPLDPGVIVGQVEDLVRDLVRRGVVSTAP
jgi:hypothetical protein